MEYVDEMRIDTRQSRWTDALAMTEIHVMHEEVRKVQAPALSI